MQLCLSPAHSKIYKKVHKDGSIEFYNVKKGKRRSKKRVKFTRIFDRLIHKYCRLEKVDPYLIKCIIKIESNFNPDAVSVSGAMGLMQLMQETASYYDIKDPMDPEENLRVGIKHFKNLMKYFKKDIPLAVAAYHAGLGAVSKKMEIPPIKSTIKYVNMVMFLYTGQKHNTVKVKKLYRKIRKDGTLLIFSK
ncbi:lytic transglycosylase domain-containing protein [Spirochaetota bacterium]